MEQFLFYLISTVCILGALGTIFNKNSINSALCLIVTMFGIAGLFALLEAHFLAVIQIAVYAGAVMVLVLFVIMLLNTEGQKTPAHGRAFWIYGVFFGAGLLFIYLPRILDGFAGVLNLSANPLNNIVSGSVENLSELLYGQHVFAFELASGLMLAALVSAVLVGKSKDES